MHVFLHLLNISEKMTDPVKTELVSVKEECGGVDVKEELVEEQDPLSTAKGKTRLKTIFYLTVFYYSTQ